MKAILEKISSRDVSGSFKVMDFAVRRFKSPFHYHPEIELTLIGRSSGHRYVGDHIGRFGPGDLVLMGANLPHMYINDENFTGKASAVVLQFLPGFLGDQFFDVAEMSPVRRLLERARLGMSFHRKTREKVVPMLERLSKLEGVARLTAFLQVLDALARSQDWRMLASTGYSPSLALYQGERINRVCELISTKFRDGISQSEAARAAGMSPPSFSRFFKRATNKTFSQFLNEVRVGYASRLLVESDRTAAQICYDAGFNNLSNFNRQFQKLRRCSPRQYRHERWRRENAYFDYKPVDLSRGWLPWS